MAWQEGGISWDLGIHHLVPESGKIIQSSLDFEGKAETFPCGHGSADPVATLLRGLSLSLELRRPVFSALSVSSNLCILWMSLLKSVFGLYFERVPR